MENLDSFIGNTQALEVFLQDHSDLVKNVKFDLRDHLHLERLPGCFEPEAAEVYSRSGLVHPDNFTQLFDGRVISKMAFGTQGAMPGLQGDFF